MSVGASGVFEVFDNRVLSERLPDATLETIQMVGFSSLFTLLLGLPLGLLLHASSPGGLWPSALAHRALGLVVNVGRSLPFLILLIAVIPFTRFVVGTNIGPEAAVVPLTLGASPFFARLVESAAREVDPNTVEAVVVMGASRSQVVVKVLVPEALPGIVAGFTTTIVTIVSYSAMAGSVGGGGLGYLAVSYGYNRFQTDVMVVTVIVLVAIVQIIQLAGDFAARRLDHR
ncbi:methionine ABC transporter permease [Parafrankia sp. EUN1f]|uniref:methionine ABC transporter permease n=1 Tax=Parafrankia sp. EUN1f TaxID=102897 RepID=UPI0001C45B1A|nr:methionine ABC transporter permease [Parafrankia sp. EUN1f]EFC81822.1 binding-protein-dependent transport systems inner membrane component [Parafrankia sp. EUN1f]